MFIWWMDKKNIPYIYMVPWVHHKILHIKDTCGVYYTVRTYKKIYPKVVHPLLEVDVDPQELDVIVLPLNLKRNVGKLKKE